MNQLFRDAPKKCCTAHSRAVQQHSDAHDPGINPNRSDSGSGVAPHTGDRSTTFRRSTHRAVIVVVPVIALAIGRTADAELDAWSLEVEPLRQSCARSADRHRAREAKRGDRCRDHSHDDVLSLFPSSGPRLGQLVADFSVPDETEFPEPGFTPAGAQRDRRSPAAQWPRDAITSSVIARNDDGT